MITKNVEKCWRTIICLGKTYHYTIIYKNVKRINLCLKDKQIVVSANKFTQLDVIDNFVMHNLPKLLNAKNKIIKHELLDIDANKIAILGRKLKVSIIITSKRYNRSELINDTVFLYLNDINNKTKVIKKFLKNQAEKYLPFLVDKWRKRMQVKYNALEFKWLESKWGSCSMSRNILLSSRLIALEEKYIDYVIVHELTHCIYFHHDHLFWNNVEKYISNYKEIKQQLKYF